MLGGVGGLLLALVGFMCGLGIGARIGCRWALDTALAAADRLGMGDAWVKEMALRAGIVPPPGWKRP